MSLYRQPGRPAARTLTAAAVAALLVGGGAGYAIGAAGGNDRPTLRDAVASVRTGLDPVRDAMELVPMEYRQGMRNGKVVAPTEYAAAKADVQRARDALRRERADLATLYPRAAATLDDLLTQLARAVGQRADPRSVTNLAAAVQAALRALPAPGVVVVR